MDNRKHNENETVNLGNTIQQDENQKTNIKFFKVKKCTSSTKIMPPYVGKGKMLEKIIKANPSNIIPQNLVTKISSTLVKRCSQNISKISLKPIIREEKKEEENLKEEKKYASFDKKLLPPIVSLTYSKPGKVTKLKIKNGI